MNNKLQKSVEGPSNISTKDDNNMLTSLQIFWRKYNTIVIFVVILILASIVSPKFMTSQNIFNVLRQTSTLGIMSLGMLMVIVMGGIDLSVGSMAALGCVFTGIFINKTDSVFIAVLLVCLIGLFLGAISGLFITLRNIAPFVMTLAMMTIARGFAYIYSKGNPIMISDPSLGKFIQGKVFYIPVPGIILLIVFAIVAFIFRNTFMGRAFLAIGSNEEAVRLSGIRVKMYKLIGYSLSGMLAAASGAIIAGRTSIGSPLVGNGSELDAIAAIVIGGASLNGGKGSALSTLLGAFILGIISNIMNLTNIPAYPQEVVKGLIIVGAVLFQQSNSKS